MGLANEIKKKQRLVTVPSPPVTQNFTNWANAASCFIFHTFNSASRNIFLDIFDFQRILSTKTIGISSIRNPAFHARYFIST
jgi:hypothetical protein